MPYKINKCLRKGSPKGAPLRFVCMPHFSLVLFIKKVTLVDTVLTYT
jgi:hypothetical protein